MTNARQIYYSYGILDRSAVMYALKIKNEKCWCTTVMQWQDGQMMKKE